MIYQAISLGDILPELTLLIGACAVLIEAQLGLTRRPLSAPLTLLTIVVAAVLARFVSPLEGSGGCGLLFGPFSDFVRMSGLMVGVLLTLSSWSQPQLAERGEYFCMMLLSLAGLLVVGAAADWLNLFLALEVVSIPTYVLVTLSRDNPRSLEAGTKYFYLGAMSAAIMAYGMSFLYGVSGSLSLPDSIAAVSEALHHPGTLPHGLATIGIVLTLTGMLFKISAVPMHFYVADVYQGAASPVAGFLGFVPKFAGVAAILKLASMAGGELSGGGLFWGLWVVALLSMTVGNVLALLQYNLKRMLAYSGVAHAGYMLVGVLALSDTPRGILDDGAAAVLYYAVIYGIANLGAFAVLAMLRYRGAPCENIIDLAGLLRRSPGAALLMALALMTLMGLPPTPGFWGKATIFGSALARATQLPGAEQTWLTALVVLGVLNTAIGAAYYLRVIAALLLHESDEPAEFAPREAPHVGALLCGFLLLFFSFFPNSLLSMGASASRDYRDQRLARVADPPPAAMIATQPPAGS